MTPNNITNTKQLSDYLFQNKVHHYLDTITTPLVPMREVVEIPIAMIASNDGSKFFNALNVCMKLIEKGVSVVKSEDNQLIWLTV